MKKKITFIVVLLVLTAAILFYFTGREKIKYIKDYDISNLQSELKEEYPTIDLVVIHSEQVKATWEGIIKDIKVAKKVFSTQGIQLNLVRAIQVQYPLNWNGIVIGKAQRNPKGKLDFYDRFDYVQKEMPQQAQTVFNSFVDLAEHPGRTIYVVTISDLKVSWFEKDENNSWKQVSAKTSAISFPSYVYADRLPKGLRGLITLTSTTPLHRTLSHELGHKLINVSHEGGLSCPKGDGDTIPGLMGYGESTEILGGQNGRWHKERLRLSPFIYRLIDHKKVWNKGYINGGIYNDSIYGTYIMNPACPQ